MKPCAAVRGRDEEKKKERVKSWSRGPNEWFTEEKLQKSIKGRQFKRRHLISPLRKSKGILIYYADIRRKRES